jgi:transposase-like protein
VSEFERWWESWLHGDDPDSIAARDAAAAAWRVRTDEIARMRAENDSLRAEAESFHTDYRMKCDEETKAQAVEIDRLRAENAELQKENTALTLLRADFAHRNAELWERAEKDRADAERLAFLYSGVRTLSSALIDIELILLNGDVPTIDEVRAAIDAARKEEQK